MAEQSDYWSDPRTWTAIIALFVAVSSFIHSILQKRGENKRSEQRDHFDADVRDPIFEELKALRASRRSITDAVHKVIGPGVPAPTSLTALADAIDGLRSFEIAHTCYELSELLRRARDIYGYLLPAERQGLLDFITSPTETVFSLYLLMIEERFDAFMEAIAELIATCRGFQPGHPLPSVSNLTIKCHDYEYFIRVLLNDLRYVITNGKRNIALHAIISARA